MFNIPIISSNPTLSKLVDRKQSSQLQIKKYDDCLKAVLFNLFQVAEPLKKLLPFGRT